MIPCLLASDNIPRPSKCFILTLRKVGRPSVYDDAEQGRLEREDGRGG